MISFERLIGDVYRLKVPFEDIYTAVFLIKTDQGDALIDCATTESDVNNVIIPALNEIGSEPKYIICTHFHGDHMGGLPYLLGRFGDAKAVLCHRESTEKHPWWDATIPKDGDELLGCLKILSLPGHSDDSIGVLDERIKTLISGDCVQLGGVGRYGTGVCNGEKYILSIGRLSEMKLTNMITSHEYYPLGSIAVGCEKVAEYLKMSRDIAYEIRDYALSLEIEDHGEIAEVYNKHFINRPPISGGTVKALMSIK